MCDKAIESRKHLGKERKDVEILNKTYELIELVAEEHERECRLCIAADVFSHEELEHWRKYCNLSKVLDALNTLLHENYTD